VPPRGYVQNTGIRRTLLQASAALVYTDMDGDGLNDTLP
jgi:hypothetical protein